MDNNRKYAFTNDARVVCADSQLLANIAAFPEVH